MMFSKQSLALATAILSASPLPSHSQSCESPTEILCQRTSTPPTVDGSFSEWTSSQAIATPLVSLAGPYPYHALMFCSYDDSKLYLGLEYPASEFSFNTTDNHFNAAIATMFQVGKDATFYMMGNCPFAATEDQCSAGGAANGTCADYLVDIGAHWELATTEQGVEYGTNGGTGNDEVANKDDEYAYSPFCRFDDDLTDAANEWTGAWTWGETPSSQYAELVADAPAMAGSYKFELTRTLTTASPETDAQLAPGDVVGFGIAYWDPLETETGWTDAGHYVSGCAADWMDLVLDDDGGMAEGTVQDGDAATEDVTMEDAESTGDGATAENGDVTAENGDGEAASSENGETEEETPGTAEGTTEGSAAAVRRFGMGMAAMVVASVVF
mmetsp:Transcript_24393/g.50100  ORF Transcript_24393/g.50100 Transcript_24393/m.50100 type:complete len:385 (+) Transcript_24393:213-1367(+)